MTKNAAAEAAYEGEPAYVNYVTFMKILNNP